MNRASCLITRPPDIIVRLLRCVEDELAARVKRPVGPDVDVGHVPHCHFRDDDACLVADPDAVTNAVQARWVDSCGEPEAVLERNVSVLRDVIGEIKLTLM
jgi:hypothetical protein